MGDDDTKRQVLVTMHDTTGRQACLPYHQRRAIKRPADGSRVECPPSPPDKHVSSLNCVSLSPPPHPTPIPKFPHTHTIAIGVVPSWRARMPSLTNAAILQANGLDTTYSIMATVKIDASPFSVDARIPAVPVPQPELQVLLRADLNVICLRINNNKNNRPTWTRCAGPCSTPSWFWAGKSWAGRARSTWAHSNTSA